MNMTYLKYFFDSVKLGSLTASAKANHVTQSAISQGIMKLEHYFEKKLLTHKRNTMKLTEEGRLLYDQSKQIFRLVEEIQNTFNTSLDYTGRLEFGCYYSVAVSLLPKPLADFQAAAPLVVPHFFTGRHDLIVKALKEGKIELGILSDQQDLSLFAKELIYQGHFRVYESTLRPPDSPVDRCIFTENLSEVRQLKNAYYKKHGKELITHMEVASWEVIVNLVLSNVGVGFFPDYLAHVPYRRQLLRPILLELEPIPYNLYAVYPQGEELSKGAQLFLKYLKGTSP